MVIYDLQCVLGHRFEGWFPNSESFQQQQREGLVACSLCGCTEVIKIPSGGHIGRSPRIETAPVPAHQRSVAESPASDQVLNIDPVVFLKSINQFIKANFKDVGGEFTRKALDMHHGRAAKEPICGTTTPEEREVLEEEGVDFTPLPKLPESVEN